MLAARGGVLDRSDQATIEVVWAVRRGCGEVRGRRAGMLLAIYLASYLDCRGDVSTDDSGTCTCTYMGLWADSDILTVGKYLGGRSGGRSKVRYMGGHT